MKKLLLIVGSATFLVAIPSAHMQQGMVPPSHFSVAVQLDADNSSSGQQAVDLSDPLDIGEKVYVQVYVRKRGPATHFDTSTGGNFDHLMVDITLPDYVSLDASGERYQHDHTPDRGMFISEDGVDCHFYNYAATSNIRVQCRIPNDLYFDTCRDFGSTLIHQCMTVTFGVFVHENACTESAPPGFGIGSSFEMGEISAEIAWADRVLDGVTDRIPLQLSNGVDNPFSSKDLPTVNCTGADWSITKEVVNEMDPIPAGFSSLDESPYAPGDEIYYQVDFSLPSGATFETSTDFPSEYANIRMQESFPMGMSVINISTGEEIAPMSGPFSPAKTLYVPSNGMICHVIAPPIPHVAAGRVGLDCAVPISGRPYVFKAKVLEPMCHETFAENAAQLTLAGAWVARTDPPTIIDVQCSTPVSVSTFAITSHSRGMTPLPVDALFEPSDGFVFEFSEDLGGVEFDSFPRVQFRLPEVVSIIALPSTFEAGDGTVDQLFSSNNNTGTDPDCMINTEEMQIDCLIRGDNSPLEFNAEVHRDTCPPLGPGSTGTTTINYNIDSEVFVPGIEKDANIITSSLEVVVECPMP